MNTRLIGSLLALSCLLFLVPCAFGGEGETKATKETVLASDGLQIVCEVRGKGDTALVFLHGWCGDREYLPMRRAPAAARSEQPCDKKAGITDEE